MKQAVPQREFSWRFVLCYSFLRYMSGMAVWYQCKIPINASSTNSPPHDFRVFYLHQSSITTLKNDARVLHGG
jgi:hypothetical protein